MKVTAWNNGKHHTTGAGYGFKISITDRDAHFNRDWRSVFVSLPNGTVVEANVAKPSFWSEQCRELINRQFGQWLIRSGHAPWPQGRPPKFSLRRIGENRFRLEET